MFSRGKYIRYTSRRGRDQLLIFHEGMTHADVAADIGALEVTSAGFIQIDDVGSLSAYGKSVSLGINSAPGDSEYIAISLGIQSHDQYKRMRAEMDASRNEPASA